MDFTGPSFSADSPKINESDICNSLKLTAIHLVGGICCYKCRLTFRDKKSYDKHYKQHNEKEIIYTCVVCESEYNNYPRFRCHCYRKHVINQKFKCDKCSKYFTKQAYLKQHQVLHVLNKYKCIPSCGFECATIAEFALHKQTNNHLPPYPCQKCNVKLYDINVCKLHIGQHAETEYVCPVCSKHISDKSHLFKHYKNILKILCIFCDMTFISKRKFIEHSQSQHNNTVFACCLCKEQYGEYGEFTEHRCAVHFPKIQETYHSKLCRVCNVPMNNFASCIEHMKMHVVKSYVCTVCSKKCNPEYLVRHVRQHFPLDFHICQTCEKTFNTLKSLRLHMKSHDERQNINYVCTLCNKNFKKHENCLKHLRDVHNVRTNIVHKREEEFVKVVPVEETVVVETPQIQKDNSSNPEIESKYIDQRSDKRHQCNECGRFFNRPSKLREHMNVHDGMQQYKCRICNKSFKFYRTYYKHLKVSHNTHPKILNGADADSTTRKMPKRKQKKFSYNEEEQKKVLKSQATMTVSNDITQEQKEHNNEAKLHNVITNDCLPANNEQALFPLEGQNEQEDDVLKTQQVNVVINNENGLDMNDNLHESNSRQESKTFQSLDNCMQNFDTGVDPTENHNLANGSVSHKSESYVEQSPNIIYTGMNTIEIDGQVISMDEDMPHIDPFLTIKPNDVDEQSLINAQIASDIYHEMAAPTWQSLITKDNYNVEYDDTSQLKADILSIIQYSEY